MTRLRLLGTLGTSLLTLTLAMAGPAAAEPPRTPTPAATTAQAAPAAPAPRGALRASAFLRIEGIDGEATEAGHEKWIELSSVRLSQSGTGTAGSPGSGAAAGRPIVSDIQIRKVVDKSSTTIQSAMASGTHYKQAVIEVVKPSVDGRVADFFHVTLTDVHITSISHSSGGGSIKEATPPTESVTLNFSNISFKYVPQAASRPTQYQNVPDGYDVKTNVSL